MPGKSAEHRQAGKDGVYATDTVQAGNRHPDLLVTVVVGRQD
jgi:hypothetical protein